MVVAGHNPGVEVRWDEELSAKDGMKFGRGGNF